MTTNSDPLFVQQILEGRRQAEASDYSYPEVEFTENDTFIVTGANTGIGYETAKAIAKMGAHVIIACRSMSKAEKAIQQMQEEYEKEFKEKQTEGEPIKLNVEKMEMDLSSLESTMKFIEDFKARNIKLKCLICNAGLLQSKRELTVDRFESMFQVNYLAQLLIIVHLLPQLVKDNDDPRIVIVSSDSYEEGIFDIDDLNSEKTFRIPLGSYADTKLYQVMSMFWLSQHLKNKKITINSLNPGFIKTQMTATDSLAEYMSYALTPDVGAVNVIKVATSPEYKGKTALFIHNCQPVPTTDLSRNVENQDILMKYCFNVLKKYLPEHFNEYIDYKF